MIIETKEIDGQFAVIVNGEVVAVYQSRKAANARVTYLQRKRSESQR